MNTTRNFIFLIASTMLLFNSIESFTQNLKISGHRGGFYQNFPENSPPLFDYTYQNASSSPIILELDIRENLNGNLFILHDTSLDRTTTAAGLLKTSSDSLLSKVFLKNSQGNISKTSIPTFNDMLVWLKNHPNAWLMLDVKGGLWKKVYDAVHQYKLEARVLFLTFKPEDTKEVFQLSPTTHVSALIRNEDDWNNIQAFQPNFKQLIAYVSPQTPVSLISALKTKGVRLMADCSENAKNHPSPFEPSFYLNLAQTMQLDIMITDYPVEVSRIFAEKNK
ncbi:glycerophosphodiester phosphodiesterase family protein [Flectobacillus sp. DC10W]|uniref:Glycerophosphodiester phosphodiesterase family protein n=1 Tax=Flectobacillus longus TaxID=2984207 RepID=A0ABT6YVT2_9BACT|nr:glycerophosphodiester phosphodiesterase family protein [Flectobacillus longus]MDI9867549.1 glycerophosphodiester phosphodiesterase family protein [Flectobacillus longus]